MSLSGTADRLPGADAERALIALAVGAGLLTCWVAREVLVPTALGLVLAATVHPLVDWLEARKLPRSLAATLGTLLATAVVAGVAFVLWDRIASFWDELPTYQARFDELWDNLRGHLVRLQRQSEKLAAPRQPGQVRVQQGVEWAPLIVGTATGVATIAAEATVVIFVIYFGLVEGPRYRAKVLARAGVAARQRVIGALAELRSDVAQYMLNRVVLNAILGAVTAIAFWLYGLEHAAVLGLTTALLHLVPYVGPAVGLFLPVAMALLQFGSWSRALGAAGIYLALVSIQGNVVDPIFLGKQLRLNALAVFLGSLFWFLLWGPIGLFLAVPLLSTIRVVCKHTERFGWVAEALAE